MNILLLFKSIFGSKYTGIYIIQEELFHCEYGIAKF